ncbi:response regulator [Candidatus Albibeggiatoa sp. nov. BB20]|uniref:response regulator n=1 Tax=Candidatus Albibeggiatoa sp. nov. BB20 TaxID=3162723 RepID=UPI00336580AA
MELDIKQAFHILIVDDNKNNLFTLDTLIKEHLDAKIVQADSGMMALGILLRNPVDLIILDVQMPEMDGFETAQLIRSRKKTCHIPIVFLTAAYKSEQFKQKGFEVGGADYLTKPIDTHQLINRIKSYLRFIDQERQHKLLLEKTVIERTKELEEARTNLEQRVLERTAELFEAKNIAEKLQSEAEHANRSKSQFLANMSHELRTPLNAIIGYSELLQEEAEELGSEQDYFTPDLKKIHGAGEHLLGLINDILDLSKIEAGKMELELESFEVETVFKNTMNTVRPLAEKNSNNVHLEVIGKLGEVFMDSTKLRQIILNLLSNALKFTEHGMVILQVTRCVDAEGEWLSFCVIDEGIGMTDQQLNKLFHPFTQADASTTRRYGGTGLGLAISKEFIEMMGGQIQVMSEFGYGSTFSVRIPCYAVIQPKLDTVLYENKTKKEGIVLVVDDDDSILYLFKDYLTHLGYAVALAKNGEEGLVLANKLRPDAILLDVYMPEPYNGWWVLDKLKQNSLLADIPVITTSGLETSEAKSLSLGAIDYLSKPVQASQLGAILAKHRVAYSGQNKLVMIVEDSEVCRETTAEMLHNVGWRVFKAENGQVALEHLAKKQPDLILLDLNMPVMDGFQFLERLQKNAYWSKIPVVVLTSQELTDKEKNFLRINTQAVFDKSEQNIQNLLQGLHGLLDQVLPNKPVIQTTSNEQRLESIVKQHVKRPE